MTVATYPTQINTFGTIEMGRPQWDDLPVVAQVMVSVMLGIEQAKKNEGTFLEDADLVIADDDD